MDSELSNDMFDYNSDTVQNTVSQSFNNESENNIKDNYTYSVSKEYINDLIDKTTEKPYIEESNEIGDIRLNKLSESAMKKEEDKNGILNMSINNMIENLSNTVTQLLREGIFFFRKDNENKYNYIGILIILLVLIILLI